MPRGQKWRGQSLHQVYERLDQARSARAAAYQIKIATDERAGRLEKEAKERLIAMADELKDCDPDYLYLSVSMECPTSPTDLCIYDTYEDPHKDDCLFCHDPLDRG
jgi:hypothetical protein